MREIHSKLDTHGERIMKVETLEDSTRARVVMIEDKVFAHIYNEGNR